MNKKLVALAVTSALALPLSAQAQTSNVTLYGRINTDFENVTATNATNGGSVLSTNRVSSNSTRFGIRGTEELAGSLKAIFQVESGFDASSNANNSSGSISPTAGNPAAGSTIASRDTFVGLRGDFGTVRLGLIDTPYKIMPLEAVNIAHLYDTGIHALQALEANCSGGFAGQACFYRRQNKSVRYDTVNLSGFTAAVQYGIENAAPGNVGNNKANLWSANLRYTNGPMKAGIAYERHNDFRSTAATSVNDNAWEAVGTYDFGIASASLIYEKLKYNLVTGGDLRRDYWSVSGLIPLGVGSVVLEYGMALDGKGSSPDGINIVGAQGHGTDTGAKQYTVGYQYDLSKRTQIYGYYTKINNRPNADFTFAYNALALPGPGASPSGIAVGLAHNF